MAKPLLKKSAAPSSQGGNTQQAGSEWIAPRDLESLLEVMARHELAELEVTRGDRKLTLRRGRIAAATVAAPAPIASAAPAPAPAKAAAAPVAESEEGIGYVTSPLVGTFYRAPSPDAASFVDVGTAIRPGQRLCIVEAMKLMNEIESEIEGTIIEILVENGKPVEYGQKLFKVRTK
jgi:acetyl-CoA carboxylase biotin carboxyl carrier protein